MKKENEAEKDSQNQVTQSEPNEIKFDKMSKKTFERLYAEFILESDNNKVNDLIVDPFTCTGTFILAANRLLRNGKGCDNSQENLNIAISRGCQLMRK